MKFTALSSALLLAGAVSAQSSSAAASASASGMSSSGNSSSSGSGAYLQAVLGALTAANLTGLVSVASSIANTTEGMALLGQLAVGNKTVFAPNNDAFMNVSQEVSSNTTLLTQILSYHILNNTYTVNGTMVAPNHTIARTLLTGGGYSLPGNRSAPVVLARNSTNATSFNIIQAADNVSAMGPAAAANLLVYIIPEVLTLPPNLSSIASQALPSLAGVIQQAGLLEPLEMSSGITVFAPIDSALSAAQSTLGMLNSTQITSVLANHVINGSVVYSTELSSSNYTSAGGEPFTFMSNSSGAYVMSANSTAKIVQSDVIIQNGVVHLIDGVLANTASNPSAAASAYSSGTAAAATMTEPTTPVTATSAAATSASTSGKTGGASSIKPFGMTGGLMGGLVGVVAAVMGGAFILA